MNRADFVARLAAVLNAPAEFNESTPLRGSELWDSTAILSTMLLMDEELGITVAASTLEDAATVRDVVESVAAKLA